MTYHTQVAPSFYPFETYGSTVTDGQVSSCSVDLPATGRWRVRACNGCGCSAWTAAETLTYYSPCL